MHVASTMVYCFVYSLEVVLMCVCMVLFEAFWWRQEEQWTRSWSFFWREREFSASPVVITTPTQEFSRQKNPMSNFFPHPTYTSTPYVRVWALNIIISQVCVIWKCYGLLLLSAHSTKNHMMRIIPEMLKWKLLILYTYFHHHRHYLFFTCSMCLNILSELLPHGWLRDELTGWPQKSSYFGGTEMLFYAFGDTLVTMAK